MTPVWVSDTNQIEAFVGAIAGIPADFGNCQAMAVIDRDGRLAAGLIFNNWDEARGVIEISCAAVSPRWATRKVINTALSYCFDDARCQAVVARHDEENARARRLWAALGAEEYIIPRLRGREASEALAVLTDDAWAKSKFNEVSHGQVKSSAAA
ncbi:GNAT family N-acetyltransferase [uncultured Roseobacter sp.]|uniref:GNAT family N-acetyltransferase n=1 Tax=uncultured Roseobacter sp. TaxID=114847 RepID=UPI002605D652|nr:GNAT family N-acetyltransferase [uncultured Roseobacter sp.]